MPLVISRPPMGAETPTAAAEDDFLAEMRRSLARELPRLPGLQPDVSERRRRRTEPLAVEPPQFDDPTLDDAIYQLERLVWAYKTGWRPERDEEGIAALQGLLTLSQTVKNLPPLRAERIVMWVLNERMTAIYRGYSQGQLRRQEYEAAVCATLTSVGLEPTEALLDELVEEKPFIDEPCDAESGSPAKGAGPAETAKYTVARALDLLGFTIPHSPRSIQEARTWSPAERARIASSESFGSNCTLPPGASPTRPPMIDLAATDLDARRS